MNGLILAGGASSRMGSDKALLHYGPLPQYKVVANLMSPYCEHIFINSNKDIAYELPIIKDAIEYAAIGPMAGILSAHKYANADWMLLGVDYPLFKNEHVAQLIDTFNMEQQTCAYYHADILKYEPFLAIIKSSDFDELIHIYLQGDYSLQSFYNMVDANKIILEHSEAITSINTPQGYQQILKNGGSNI